MAAFILPVRLGVQIGTRSVGQRQMHGAAIGGRHGLALHGRPQARRLRRPAPRLRGLTSATQRQRSIDAVVGRTAAPSGAKYRACPTLSGQSSADFLRLGGRRPYDQWLHERRGRMQSLQTRQRADLLLLRDRRSVAETRQPARDQRASDKYRAQLGNLHAVHIDNNTHAGAFK